MCLAGDQENLAVEFYKDAQMGEPMGLRIPVDKLNIQDLGIQLTQGIATHSYLKLVHNDEQQLSDGQAPKYGQRTVYLLGV